MNRAVGLAAMMLSACAAVWLLRRSKAMRRTTAPARMIEPRPSPEPYLSAVGKGMAEVGAHPVSPGGGSRGHVAKARRRDAT